MLLLCSDLNHPACCCLSLSAEIPAEPAGRQRRPHDAGRGRDVDPVSDRGRLCQPHAGRNARYVGGSKGELSQSWQDNVKNNYEYIC